MSFNNVTMEKIILKGLKGNENEQERRTKRKNNQIQRLQNNTLASPEFQPWNRADEEDMQCKRTGSKLSNSEHRDERQERRKPRNF